jgi:ribonuclease BN (tRNA processing enzyme)
MRVVVLGTGGGWPRPRGAACGYLLRHDGFNLWLDAGTGSLANLQQHVRLEDVHAVAISHRHFDHFLDLYPFYLSLWWQSRPDKPPPIPMYAPPGMFEHALQLEEDLPTAFRSHAVEPGDGFEVGPFVIDTVRTAHPVPTLGMRIEADGRSLAYTADTGPCEPLVSLAEGADLMLSESTWLEQPAGSASGPIHLTAAQAGDQAKRAGVDRLILTHVWPAFDPAQASDRASEAFDGEVVEAKEGMVVEL